MAWFHQVGDVQRILASPHTQVNKKWVALFCAFFALRPFLPFWGIAELGLEAIKERQAAGIAAAKKAGVYNQGKHRPKGSTKADPRRAIELREQGIKKVEIARLMGVDRKTVNNYLKAAETA